MPAPEITPLEHAILQTIGGCIDEQTLCGDQNSFVEMEQRTIHVASDKHGDRFFRVTLTEVTKDQYTETDFHRPN